jgi:hypothetical protein
MPADVARRLDEALAAARGVPKAAPTVVPLSSRQRRNRPSWHSRLAQAAAVLVLLAAVGGIGYGAFSGGSGSAGGGASDSAAGSAQKGAGADREAAGGRGIPVSQTGRDYTAATLRTAVPGLLSGVVPRTASGGQSLNASPGQADASGPPDAATLARCAQSLAGKPVAPLAADVAKFDHKPALVIVLPTPGDKASVDVFALPPGCPTGEVLQFERVALP